MRDGFTFYDLETTGISPRYDVPVQFAAVRTDADLNILDEVEFRGRPPSWVLPSPGALVTTGQSYSDLMAAPLSFYQFMRRVMAVVEQNTPSCFCAYNGIRFDDEMLRHSFYQTLQQPYAIQMNGNARVDALKLMHAVHMLLPGQITVPVTQAGNPTFKLESLAAANGVDAFAAHDALADVHATIEMVRLVRDQASEVWNRLSVWNNKSGVIDLLSGLEPICSFDWRGKSGTLVRSLLPICRNPAYPAEWALFDLAADPVEYLDMDTEELTTTFNRRSGERPLVRLRANTMPLVLTGNDELAVGRPTVDETERVERSRIVQSHPDFTSRVAETISGLRQGLDEPQYVEDQLYSGGFFPVSEDRNLFEQFHRSELDGLLGLVGRFTDPRARQIGLRLVYDEHPDLLDPHHRQEIAKALHERQKSDEDVPWLTVQKALAEIDAATEESPDIAIPILSEYRNVLERIG